MAFEPFHTRSSQTRPPTIHALVKRSEQALQCDATLICRALREQPMARKVLHVVAVLERVVVLTIQTSDELFAHARKSLHRAILIFQLGVSEPEILSFRDAL